MARTAADVTPDEMEVYRAHFRRRREAQEVQRAAREQDAWRVVPECARLLRDRFGASRVVLFGSLARGTFGSRSDIDLCVWGLSFDDYLLAIAELMGVSHDIEVNVVRYENAKPGLRQAIQQDGIEL